MDNLEGRFARCTCGSTAPSLPKLGYFEFRGDGSVAATKFCGVCGHTENAHSAPSIQDRCNKFVPRGTMDYDSYFCGHLSGQ